MKTLLISVHPSHSQNILDGKKTIELRKTEPRAVEHGLLYETSPTKAIVAKFKIVGIHQETIKDLIAIQEQLCLSAEEIKKYLPRGLGWCINIKLVQKFKSPISLSKMKEVGIMPPQSYFYLSEDQVKNLIN